MKNSVIFVYLDVRCDHRKYISAIVLKALLSTLLGRYEVRFHCQCDEPWGLVDGCANVMRRRPKLFGFSILFVVLNFVKCQIAAFWFHLFSVCFKVNNFRPYLGFMKNFQWLYLSNHFVAKTIANDWVK